MDVDDGGPAVEIRLDERWLACSARVRPVSTGAELWDALVKCPSLAGMCKPSIEPGGRGLDTRVDVPLDEGTELRDACRSAVGDLLSARRMLLGLPEAEDRGRSDGASLEPREPVQAEEPSQIAQQATVPPEAVRAAMDACAGTEWPVLERPDGGIRVDLTGAGGPRHANVRPFGGESYRVHVLLGLPKGLGPVSRTAVAILLLHVNGAVRFARTGIVEYGGRAELFGEVWIREKPTGALFDHAFSALALIYRLCRMELRTLGDETVARAYTEARGWSCDERTPAPQGEAATS